MKDSNRAVRAEASARPHATDKKVAVRPSHQTSPSTGQRTGSRSFSTRFFLPARTKSYFLLLYVRSTILVSHHDLLTKD